jgi:hypothetical protein
MEVASEGVVEEVSVQKFNTRNVLIAPKARSLDLG